MLVLLMVLVLAMRLSLSIQLVSCTIFVLGLCSECNVLEWHEYANKDVVVRPQTLV